MTIRIGIIFALVLFLSAMVVLSVERKSAFPVPERSGSALENVAVTHSEKGEKVWELQAARADLGDDMKVAVLKDLVLYLQMETPLRVTGKWGRYRFEDGHLSIAEGAVLQTADWTLKSEKLNWSSQEGLISTDQDVTMEARSFSLQGTGFEADTRKEIARVSNVRCTFYSF